MLQDKTKRNAATVGDAHEDPNSPDGVNTKSVVGRSDVVSVASNYGDKVAPWLIATAYFLPSCSFAAATTRSGSKPNLLCSSLSGAEAPNVFMPMTRPDSPT